MKFILAGMSCNAFGTLFARLAAWRGLAQCFSGLLFLLAAARIHASPSASFGEFDRKARAGDPLTVVFFGGSLTWGANASDPQTTSWRGLMMDYLRKKYPRTPFTFYDAAIGGTGSKLGMFRIDRDVFSRNPDLVFYDFTANDDLEGSDVQTLASYESLLRAMIGRGIPVEQEFFCFKYNKAPASLKLPRYLAHKKLAEAYHTATGDALASVSGQVLSGKADPDVIWPADGAHPYDAGYRMFFEAVRDGLEKALAEGRVCTVPASPVFGLYEKTARAILVESPLPKGWRRHTAYRTSLWFDGLSSRWIGDVAVCGGKDQPQSADPLKIDFTGTFVGLFGETAGNGLSFKAKVDGVPLLYKAGPKEAPVEIWANNLARFVQGWKGAHLFKWIELSNDLAPGKHTLEIDPVFDPANPDGELHIESVCSAGQ